MNYHKFFKSGSCAPWTVCQPMNAGKGNLMEDRQFFRDEEDFTKQQSGKTFEDSWSVKISQV